MKKFAFVLLTFSSVMAWMPEARADRRNFAWLYEPKIMPAGETELEYYMTGVVHQNPITDANSFNWAHQVEVEYGIFDTWDVSMYQMFSPTEWRGYKLRTRYRPYFPGELPIDFLFYLELIGLRNGDFGLEEKLVLGRHFGKFSVSLDSTFEQMPLGGEPSLKWLEAIGLTYEFAPWVALGLETQARMGWERKEVYDGTPELSFVGTSVYIGPTISLAGERIWWNVNYSTRVAGEETEAAHIFRVLWGIFL